jgi:hypothetical protein
MLKFPHTKLPECLISAPIYIARLSPAEAVCWDNECEKNSMWLQPRDGRKLRAIQP